MSDPEIHRQLIAAIAPVCLALVGDAVIATDAAGRVTFLNPAAEALTGWSRPEAEGRDIAELYRIIDGETRAPLESPTSAVLREGRPARLPPHRLLLTRDGRELPITDTAAPIPGEEGQTVGAVLVFHDISSQRQSEAALRAAEEYLRMIIESVRDYAIFSVDPEGRITTWNSGAERLFGYPEEEILGRNAALLFTPEDRVAGVPARELATAAATGRAEDDRWHLRRDGSRFFASGVVTPIYDGELRGFSKVVRDITERRQLEARLDFLVRLSDATRPLAEPAEIMETVACQLGEHLGVSRCAYAEIEEDEDHFVVYGDYTRDCPSIVGRHRLSDFGAQLLSDLRAGHTYVVNDVQQVSLAEDPLAALHLARIQAIVCVPLIKESRLVAAVAVHQDYPRQWSPSDIRLVEMVAERAWPSIERTRADLRLRQTATRLSLALDSARLGDWSWSADARIVTLSERAAEIFGVPPGPSRSWNQIRSLLHPEDQEPTQRAIEQSLADHVDYQLQYRVARPEGGWRWVSATGHGLYGPDGKVQGMLGIVQDITERRQLEDQLRERAEQLAEAGRRKSDYLTMLAHELRNPLAPILSAVQMLRILTPGDSRLRRPQEIIERQVLHQARLIDDLLNVTRLTHGKVELHRERLDLVERVRRTTEDLREVVEGAGLTLYLELPPHPVWVDADPTRLAQVLDNLLQNAAKFTEPGGQVTAQLTITDALKPIQQPGAQGSPGRSKTQYPNASVTVRDTGVGIPPELLPHVFDTFTQADRSLDRSRGGLGLGLALVKGLVELHGGAVCAESDGPGRGAAFTFILPLAGSPSAELAASLSDAPRSHPWRILIVEDNRDAADSLARLLELVGHTVELAYSGVAALETARQFRPEVVLCDLGLPSMDGYSVAAALRQDPATAAAHLIAVSGYGEEADRRRAREAGFDAHLVKPVELEQLQHLLAALP
jgi:PAS domain S-box-containing protein